MKKTYSVLSAFLVVFLVSCGDGTSTDPNEREYNEDGYGQKEFNEDGQLGEDSFQKNPGVRDMKKIRIPLTTVVLTVAQYA